MKFYMKLIVVIAILLVNALNLNADPTIRVTIHHPPALGLKVNKIAFGAAEGECSDQIVQSIISDMVSNQLEVIDRAHLNSILAEHNLTFSGYVDGSSAASIGKILGPSAMIFVKVQRCTTTTNRTYEDKSFYNYSTSSSYTKRIYTSKTRAFFTASIQTVDLTTGRIFAAQSLEFSPQKENESEEGYPEYPAPYDVIDYAMRLAVNKIHQMFLPWDEARDMVFFDDRSFGLREASQAMQASDLERALSLTRSSINACLAEGKNNGKVLSHAYYNVGVIHMVQNQLDSALSYFRNASQAKPEQLYNEAISECIKAKEVTLAMQKYESRSMDISKSGSAGSNGASSLNGEGKNSFLTNEDIVVLTKSKISNALIMQKIKSSKCKFDTTTDGLVKLTNAGVNEEIIKAMIEKN